MTTKKQLNTYEIAVRELTNTDEDTKGVFHNLCRFIGMIIKKQIIYI
jgi:hypothetical protein